MMRLAYEEAKKSIPRNLAAHARSYLRMRNYCSRAVTHTAQDLPADHAQLIETFRDKLKETVQVRVSFS